MTPPDLQSPSAHRTRGRGATARGILGDIDLDHPPFCGDAHSFFSPSILESARRLVENNAVRIVTCNVQGNFAGIFGHVDEGGEAETREVGLLVQKTLNGEWLIDGRAGPFRAERQSLPVAALLLAAMSETGGAARSPSRLSAIPQAPVLHLFSRDVRAGILHWEDSDARAVPENLVLLRFENPTDELLRAIEERGLKPLVSLHPCDEVPPELHDCYAHPGDSRSGQDLFWAEFLANHRRVIEDLGCTIRVASDLDLRVVESSEWYGEIRGQDDPADPLDWFEFECGVVVDGRRINIAPCLVKYLEGQPPGFLIADPESLPEDERISLRLDDDGEEYLAIPTRKLHAILGILTEIFDDSPLTDSDSIRVHPLRAAQLLARGGEDGLVNRAPTRVRQLAEDFASLRPTVDPEAPADFRATLRPYQRDGFRWLQFLREQGVGGILADDMGLGKTIQTLCHLHHEKISGRADLPTLIIAPKSVVPNWEKEARKFAPSLSVLVLQGPKRKKYYPVMGYSDLVITSYPVLLRDAEELLLQSFHYVVLDEAHTIKNATARVTRAAYRIDARHRLCLSGTPIENHLGELWSLFHFLMPGFLGSEESFTRCFRIPIEKHRDETRRRRLAERVAPLMLRRTKSLVATDLPPKTEIVSKVELDSCQIDLYEAVRAAVQREVRDEIERHGIEGSRLLVLEALMKLRQICCHPRLLSLPSAREVSESAKLRLLLEWLPGMAAEGRRILIFSQFTRMLDLIEEELDGLGIPYLTLTGQSRDRGALCDRFQSGAVPVFLISLRAGGTGLNLTRADTVIHYDPWWNPALESQATDRAYRIGQKNPVFVYKLISEGTIEEKILMLQDKKRALFEGILEGAPQKLDFSEKDLDNLLAPISG